MAAGGVLALRALLGGSGLILGSLRLRLAFRLLILRHLRLLVAVGSVLAVLPVCGGPAVLRVACVPAVAPVLAVR